MKSILLAVLRPQRVYHFSLLPQFPVIICILPPAGGFLEAVRYLLNSFADIAAQFRYLNVFLLSHQLQDAVGEEAGAD